jgi:hypothetical protein
MADGRNKRLEQYEAWAAEYEILARAASDRTTQNRYAHLAMHYRYLATSFRDALAIHGAALPKLTLH